MAYGGEAGETFNTLACVECHSDMEDAPDFNRDNVQTDVESLIAQMEAILINANLLAYYAEEGAWLAAERDVLSRSEPGDSAGALWNYFVAKYDRSEGIHNPDYIKGLLESALEFMQGPGLASPPVVVGENRKTAQ
jgi:hypothetical protein